MAKDYKINIFELLEQADKNNKNYYSNMLPEQKEQFSPFQIMRWYSGIDGHFSEYYLNSINELLNVDFALISKHPELFWKLASAIGIGQKQRHHWINPIGRSKTYNKLYSFFFMAYPQAKETEINMVIDIIPEKDLIQLLNDYAIDDDEQKNILKEYKNVRM